MSDSCGGVATFMGLRGGGRNEKGNSAKEGATTKPSMFSGKKLERLSGQLTELFPVWVLIAVVVGITKPSMVAWLTPNLITMAVSAVMVFTGMTLEIEDFQEILKKPSQVALGCVCQFGIMPFLSSGIVRAIGMQPDIAAGVILLGSCPGGTSSNLITLIAGGDVALSVLMTSASTILAPFLTSTMVGLLAGAFVDIDMLGMFKSVRQKSIPRCRARAMLAQCKSAGRASSLVV
jgi:BASS family bile acid:Na+ symporter